MIVNSNYYLPETFRLDLLDGQSERYEFKLDTTRSTIAFRKYNDTIAQYQKFIFQENEASEFVFKGVFEGDSLEVHTKAKGPKDYPLTQKGIRWITDLKEAF